MTWQDVPEPPPFTLDAGGVIRAVLRAIPLAFLVFGGLIIVLLLRLIERPLYGLNRPVTPHVTVFVCRNALRLLGISLSVTGQPMRETGAVVANHASWLDIFALNACQRVYFVSKSEVAAWPGIGWLARAVGTVFIRRDPRDAAKQRRVFENRLAAGHRLLFFPEGTSSDGRRVLPFKSTLFAAFFLDPLKTSSSIQPATLTYHAPVGEDENFYGWWGDMEFGPHLLQTLAAKRQGAISLVFGEPLRVEQFCNRKDLAVAAESAVRAGLKI